MDSEVQKAYEYCIVPECTSSTIKTPSKRFLSVPRQEKLRKKWFKACMKDQMGSSTSKLYCCEDHFKVEEDCSNVVKHNLTGCRLKLKDNILPHVFDCQPDRKLGHSVQERTYWSKKQRNETINECLNLNSTTDEPTMEDMEVCEKHFKPSDVIRETRFFDTKEKKWITFPTKTTLKKGALPSGSIMWDIGSKAAKRRKTQKSNDNQEIPPESSIENNPAIIFKHSGIADELDEIEMIQRIDFTDLTELKENLHLFDQSDFWTIATGKKTLAFIHIKWTHVPKIHLSVVVDENLLVSVFHEDDRIKATKTFSFPKRVRNITELKMILKESKEKSFVEPETSRKVQLVQRLLDSLKENLKEHKVTLSFLREQVSLLTDKREQKLYSPDMLIFATLLFSMAPHAYKFLVQCENLILPELDIIKNLYIPLKTSPNKDISPIKFLKHAKESFSNLTNSDKFVVLKMEEIYLKPFLEVDENISGMSVEMDAAATSVYAFMIASLNSTFKDTVHLLPVQPLRVKDIHNVLKEVIIGLEYIGFCIVAVVTDDSLESKQVMSLFSEPPLFNSIIYKHPFESSRPLFHLINYAHLLKNIRNDWMHQDNPGECIFYPSIENETDNRIVKRASFLALKKLHDVESSSYLKYFGSFSSKAILPSNSEKHNIEFVLEIFNNVVSNRLVLYGEDHTLLHYQDTADFIKLICTWWSIVNPSSSKDGHVEDQSFVYLSATEKSYVFLQKFLDWLDRWSNNRGDSGMLTAKTFSALHLSTYALIELTAYCKNELGMHFILPGNFQTDYPITRFGFLRELPNLQFFHKKQWPRFEPNLTNMTTLLLTLIDVNDLDLTRLDRKQTVNLTEAIDYVYTFIPMIITDEDMTSNEVNIPVLLYLAGYCVRSVLKELNCQQCKSHLSTNMDIGLHPTLIEIDTNEEPLKYPSRNAMNLVVLSFIVLSKLCKEYANEFWTHTNRNSLAYNLTMNILESIELDIDYRFCGSGHSSSRAVKMIVRSVVYYVLNNYDEGYTSDHNY